MTEQTADIQNQIRNLLQYALLAPSVDNCQPWTFGYQDNQIDIFLDKPRAAFFGDYAFTASYVTMGAVVENIAIAADHCGLVAEVESFPGIMAPAPVARLSFSGKAAGISLTNELFPALEKRCTNRRWYRRDAVESSLLEGLRTVLDKTAHLIITNNPVEIGRFAGISQRVDQVIFEHQQLHQNLVKWMRWTKEDVETKRDGLGIGSLELNRADRIAFRVISSWPVLDFLNRFGISRLIAKSNSDRLRRSPAVGLLFVEGSTNHDFFHGGRLLERIWLKATASGLAFQPYGGLPFLLTRIQRAGDEGFSPKHFQILQEVQQELRELARVGQDENLIMLFRLGYAKPPSEKTLRRPLSDVLKN